MRKIAGPARERIDQIDDELMVKERELGDLLQDDDVEVEDATARMAEIEKLRAENDRITVIIPLELRQVLTVEQREKAVELWRQRVGPRPLGKHPPHKGPHHGPPGKAGPPFGKHPPSW